MHNANNIDIARRRRQVINRSSVLNVNIEHIRLKIQLIILMPPLSMFLPAGLLGY